MKEKIKAFKKEILVVSAFILLSIYATFPVIFRFSSCFYGNPTDPLAWLWGFWWFKYSYLHGITSKFVPILAYPFGYDHPPLYPIWAVFIKWLSVLTGEIAAYNLQILLSFFLSGLAMYLLVYYFTKNRRASFFSGVVFMFCPYHFARSWDHLCLSNMHWMVFYIISLFNLYQKRTYKSAFICGVCFALIGQFSSYYYVYFMILFTAVFFIFNGGYALFRKQRISLKEVFQFAKLSIAGLTAIVLIMLPQIWRYLKVLICSSNKAQETGLIRSFGQLFADSARPLNYFLPTEYHPILGGLARFFINTPLYGENSGGEQSLYLGIIPLVLAYIGYKQWRKDKMNGISAPKTDFLTRFWVLALFSFMICSFSPYWGNINSFFIPFPSFFLYKIFPMFRNYARMGVLVMISVCVLAGFGLTRILEGFSSNKKKFVVVGLLVCGVLFEFLNVPPYRITDASKTPEEYLWLKEQPENTVVAEYPIDADGRPILFYQRVHQKSLINGAMPGTYAYEVMQKIIDLENGSTAGILSFLGANYVIIHKDKYSDYEGGGVLGKVPDMAKHPEYVLVKDFPDAVVYKVNAMPIDPKTVVVAAPAIKSELKLPSASLFDARLVFQPEFSFRYSVTYMGIVSLLRCEMVIGKEVDIENRLVIPLRARFWGNRTISWLFDVEAEIESLFDKKKLCAFEYREFTSQGKKRKEKVVVFNQDEHFMEALDKKVKIEPNTQDSLSAIWFLSRQEFESGRTITMYINPGKSNYKLQGVVLGKETLTVRGVRKVCWKISADLFKIKNREKKLATLLIWIDDIQRELVVLRASTQMGILKMELED